MVLALTERVQRRTVDVPMPQVLEETVEAARLVPRQRVQQRTAEQRLVPQEGVRWIDEQVTEVFSGKEEGS